MNWLEYFLLHAVTAAAKSKDPSTKVGAVIFDQYHRMVSVGYNGFPQGVNDSPGRLSDRATRLSGTLHAEDNAILFAERNLSGCSIAVWPLPPCAHCAARIVQVGIDRVFVPEFDFGRLERWRESFDLGNQFFVEAGVGVTTYADPDGKLQRVFNSLVDG